MGEREFQAGLRFGRERGVNNAWNEPEFMADVMRMEEARPTLHEVTLAGAARPRFGAQKWDGRLRAGRQTRFGRSTWSRAYPVTFKN